MMKNRLLHHPLLLYFAMAFGISWGGIGCVVAATGFNLAAPQPMQTGLFFVAMLLGPSVSGLILTALLEGREGLGALGSHLSCWRVGGRWYAVALLTAPLLLLAILWMMSALAAPAFAPHFQWAFLAVGLVAGSFEEIGWTGFATPLLLARHGLGTAGLQLGLVWALWHALVVFLFTFGEMGNSWIWSFVIVYLATLTPYRIVMTWLYANTQSVLLAVLMHASYTGWLLVLFPATSPAQSLVWQSAFAAALWIVAALVLCKSAHRLERDYPGAGGTLAKRGNEMIATVLTRDARLPAAVYELAVRLGADPKSGTRDVRLKQTGRMKPKLETASWMPFTATQTISTRTCEFDWRARAGPFGMISARDALANGEGRLDVTALGFIPIARAERSPALVRGELMRYLAELAWAPDAILHNTELRWRKDGPDTLAVSAGSGAAASEVVLSLDSEGRIAGAFSPDRPRSATAPVLSTPWRGRFSDYRRHNDRWLPFAGEVAWEIDGKEIVYWQARIEHWEMDSGSS